MVRNKRLEVSSVWSLEQVFVWHFRVTFWVVFEQLTKLRPPDFLKMKISKRFGSKQRKKSNKNKKQENFADCGSRPKVNNNKNCAG